MVNLQMFLGHAPNDIIKCCAMEANTLFDDVHPSNG